VVLLMTSSGTRGENMKVVLVEKSVRFMVLLLLFGQYSAAHTNCRDCKPPAICRHEVRAHHAEQSVGHGTSSTAKRKQMQHVLKLVEGPL
jgi:hypothetical protein